MTNYHWQWSTWMILACQFIWDTQGVYFSVCSPDLTAHWWWHHDGWCWRSWCDTLWHYETLFWHTLWFNIDDCLIIVGLAQIGNGFQNFWSTYQHAIPNILGLKARFKISKEKMNKKTWYFELGRSAERNFLRLSNEANRNTWRN